MMRVVALLLLFQLVILPASAQSIRYIDESGNIHWVDTLTQVPPQYRSQVLKPTLAPGSEREFQEQQRRQQAAKRLKDREELKKQRELDRQKKEESRQAERQRKIEEKKKAEEAKKKKIDDIRNRRLTPIARPTKPPPTPTPLVFFTPAPVRRIPLTRSVPTTSPRP